MGSFSPKGHRCCTVVEKWNRMETREEIIVVFKDNFAREDMHLRYFFSNSMVFALNPPIYHQVSFCDIFDGPLTEVAVAMERPLILMH